MKPIGNPNRVSNSRGGRPKRTEWLPKRNNGLLNGWNTPNKAPWAQDRISITWLSLWGSATVQKSGTTFWMCNAEISTPTATNSRAVVPITTNTRSLMLTPGVYIATQHSDKRRWQTRPNRWATYLWNPTYPYTTSTSFHNSCLRFMRTRTDDGWQWSRSGRDRYNFNNDCS